MKRGTTTPKTAESTGPNTKRRDYAAKAGVPFVPRPLEAPCQEQCQELAQSLGIEPAAAKAILVARSTDQLTPTMKATLERVPNNSRALLGFNEYVKALNS